MIAIIWKRPTVGKWPRVDEFFWGAETEASASEQLDESVADEKKRQRKCVHSAAGGPLPLEIPSTDLCCSFKTREKRRCAHKRSQKTNTRGHPADTLGITFQPPLCGVLRCCKCGGNPKRPTDFFGGAPIHSVIFFEGIFICSC